MSEKASEYQDKLVGVDEKAQLVVDTVALKALGERLRRIRNGSGTVAAITHPDGTRSHLRIPSVSLNARVEAEMVRFGDNIVEDI